MPRLNREGKYILAAGEIAHFTVCPEAWRLSALEKSETLSDPSHETGRELHKHWAKKYEDSVVLSRSVRMIIEILFLLILSTLLRYS
jgi:hypothetical protein